MSTLPEAEERQTWGHHWRRLEGEHGLVGLIASVTRKVLLSPAVRHYTDRYFSDEGWFVEAGCGTAESSAGIRKKGRRLVGVDFSLEALCLARRQPVLETLICADIRRLPFRDSSLAGIWNLGVLEHFEPPAADQIVSEVRRTLMPQGVALLFWPPTFGLSRWVLAPFEWLKSRSNGRPFHFFPDEVNRLASKRAGRDCLETAGLRVEAIDFTPRAGFNHLVVVGRRETA